MFRADSIVLFAHMKHVQDFASGLVSLSTLTARELDVDSVYAHRITICSDIPEPIYIRSFDRCGHARPLTELSAIHHFIPVDGAIDTTAGNESVLQSLRDIATDLVNQGGINEIGNGHIRDTMEQAI